MKSQSLREKIHDIVVKDMWNLNDQATTKILAAVREEVEGMKKNVTDDSSGYYREALSDVLEKLK